MKGGEAVLFDRVNDPDQVQNIYDSSDHADTVRELTQRIVQHHRQVASPATEWLEAIDR